MIRQFIVVFILLIVPCKIGLGQEKSEIFALKDTLLAKSYFDSAEVYYKKADYNNSKRLYYGSLAIFRSLYGEKNKKVFILYQKVAFVEGKLGNTALALDYQKKNLELSLTLFGEASKESAGAYANLGIIYSNLEIFDKAEYYLGKTLQVYRQLFGENSNEVARIYINLGCIGLAKNDLDYAIVYHKKALAIGQKLLPDDHEDLAAIYNNLAVAYAEKGDYDLSNEYEKKGLVIRQAIYGEMHPATAWSYNNIGSNYKDKKEFDKALYYQKKALGIRLQTLPADHVDIVASYMNISNIYTETAMPDTALYYQYKALKSGVKMIGIPKSKISTIYFNIAGIYADLAKYDSAIVNYNKAISIGKSIFSKPNPQIALYLQQVAESYLAYSKPHLAKECLDTAILYNISDAKAIDLPDSIMPDYAVSHKIMSLILHKRAKVSAALSDGNIESMQKSISYYELALSEADKAKFEIVTENSKLNYGEATISICDDAISELFKLNKISSDQAIINKALHFSEKSKASVLYESLSTPKALMQAGVPEDIIRKEKNFRLNIAYYETKRKASSEGETYFEGNTDSILFALRLAYKQYFDSITISYPLIAKLKQEPIIANVNEIKNNLGLSSAVIEYFTGKEKTYAIVITPEKQSFIELPTDTSLALRIKKFLAGIRKNNPELTYTNGKWLYKSIIEPILPVIKGAKELLIIPDQALSSIPFEVLISGGNINKPSFLIEKYLVSYQNSASIWYERNKLQASKNYTRGNLFDFIGFAPVFKNNNDYAALRGEGFTERYGSDTVFFESSDDRSYFRELPNSDKEVTEIASLFDKANLKATVFTYQLATKGTFREKSPNCRILHIATHAYADNADPELSWLAFSQTDTSASKNNDGILYAGEIYGLSLKADLAVLSACETGIGKVVKGEGVMSIARSMMYAGVPNIIISLWKVGDLDTRLLMVEFYKAYLSGKKYSEALRTAKLEMLRKSPANPKSWAGFVLFGT